MVSGRLEWKLVMALRGNKKEYVGLVLDSVRLEGRLEKAVGG
jgi:hypothetical protein